MAAPGDAAKTLEGELQGELIRPGDGTYDEARSIWNGMIDRRPALIARCAGPGDVAAAVRFARRRSCRGGPGRRARRRRAGGAEDGLMVDLSAMRAVQVESIRGARCAAQGGATLADLDRGDAGVRPGRAGRRRLRDRDRRADAGRRDRMAAREARHSLDNLVRRRWSRPAARS